MELRSICQIIFRGHHKTMTYEEFLEKLELEDGKMASLLWDLYQQCKREDESDDGTNRTTLGE